MRTTFCMLWERVGVFPASWRKMSLLFSEAHSTRRQNVAPLLDDVDSHIQVTDGSSKAPKCDPHSSPSQAGRAHPEAEAGGYHSRNGDIVYIQSRDAEVFYTGGLLKGGQFPIPRDYDLDVLGAMAMAGGSIAAAAGGSGIDGIGTGVGSIFPPTRVLVLRIVDGRQSAIEVDLKQAMRDPGQRILIEPNDLIVLEYRPTEVVMNTILSTFRVNMSLDSIWN